MNLLVFKLLLITPFVVFASNQNPEITITQGILRGKTQETESGKTFSSFTAIPYAKPPVGELRFKPPVPAEPWDGVLDATKPHSVCPQKSRSENDKIIGDEDCLYLNVYTPQLPTSEEKLLAVMIYIHGGGWNAGSGILYSPHLFMDKGVVLVTINYRLGAFGFLTTGDGQAIGNDAFKDQVLAIKWAKQNIDKFGGDPNSITLFGQSAGGASVHYHMFSPLSKNLIKGVIAQSGTVFTNWALMPHFLSTRRSKFLASYVGCKSFNTIELMECFRSVDAYDIVRATDKFKEWDVDPLIVFKPVIEPKLPGAFMPEDPIELIKAGKIADIPFMTGLTSDEGDIRTVGLFSQPDLVKDLNENFTEIAPKLLFYDEIAALKHMKGASPTIREFYFQDQPIAAATRNKFTEMYSDAMILSGADVAVDLHTKFSKQPVYYYLFAYKGSASYCSEFSDNRDDYGVCHSDELLYLFNHDFKFPGHKPTESDTKMSEFLTTLWTNFAKYGNPTPENDPRISVKWEPVQKQKQNFYHIKTDEDVELSQDLYKERATFWRDLPMNIRRTWIRDEL